MQIQQLTHKRGGYANQVRIGSQMVSMQIRLWLCKSSMGVPCCPLGPNPLHRLCDGDSLLQDPSPPETVPDGMPTSPSIGTWDTGGSASAPHIPETLEAACPSPSS